MHTNLVHSLKQEYNNGAAAAAARSDYYCHDCNISFDHANGFLDHVSQVHPEQNNVVGQQTTTTAAAAAAAAANIMEIGKMILRCPTCPAAFHRTNALREHMQTVHHLHQVVTFTQNQQQQQPQQQMQQQQGDFPAATPGDGLFCPQCKNPFANKYSLMKHLRSTRCRQDSEATINRIINDQLTCTRCRKQFGSIQALNKHVEARKCNPPSTIRDTTNVGGTVARVPQKGLVFDDSIQLTPYATVTVFRCPDRMCAKPCVTLRAFKMHAKCVHKGLEINPVMEEAKANFICKVRGCGKLFVEEQQLDVHFKHHENYTPRSGKHRCHICQEAFYQKDMLKRHVLSFHDEVSSFRGRGKGKNKGGHAGGNYKRSPFLQNLQLKYNPELTLAPGTLMRIYKCPVESCSKKSCTDMKSFKLHCMHIHQDKSMLPIIENAEAKYICQVDGCGKLYMERKQYEIHQRHHKTYVPSKGRYYKCTQCDSKFNSQSNLDVHTIQVHMGGGGSANGPTNKGKNDLIFDDITLDPGTMMTVFHCPVVGCDKRNYLDAKSVRTHCRRFHSMIDFEGIPSQAEAQYICQVRGCRKLFMEPIQIEAHLKHHRNYIPTNGVFECHCCPETFTRKEQLDQHTLNCHTTEGIMRSHQSTQQPVIQGAGSITINNTYNSQFTNRSVHHGVHGSHLRQPQDFPRGQIQQVQVQQQPLQHQQHQMAMQQQQQPKVVGYQCSICMRKFLHLGTHCNHVNNVHQSPGLQPIEVDMKPRYTCKHPRCGKHFMTKNMFRAHMDRHQTGKGKKSMTCFKCGRTFSQFKSLYQHVVQTHADVTDEEIAELESNHAKCPVCFAVFRSVDIMRVHLRRHQDQKIIVNNVLPPSSTTTVDQQQIQIHVQQQQPGDNRTTFGNVSKKCALCMAEFFDDVSLQRHVLAFHAK